jgi:dimeric dUTPase (all-alpha-NTP-PPase superfamily)
MNINKLYRNQEERIQDEMNQVKADALRKNILGGNLQAMMHG